MNNIRHEMNVVKSSSPIHNCDYTAQILENAYRELSGVPDITNQR